MINILLNERDRISFNFVMFSFACTHFSTRFLIWRAQRATISRVYSFAYTLRNFVLEGSYISTTSMMTIRSVAQMSLAFSRLRQPSRVGFRLRLWFIYCKCSSLASPVARTKASWPPPRSYNFVLPYRAHFSLLSFVPTHLSLIIIIHHHHHYHHHYHYSIIQIRLASFFPSFFLTFVQCRFLLPQKWTRAIYVEFFPFWRSRFLYY